MQAVLTLNDEIGCADAFDLSAHGHEHIAQINNFRLPRGIVQYACPLGETGRHQGVFSRADGNDGKGICPARNTLFGNGFDIAGRHFNLDAKSLQRLEVKVNRPVADRASARQRNGCFTRAGQHWAKH